MARKFESDYRLSERDDVLLRLRAILRDVDLRVDAIELLGEAFANGNRLDVDALVKSINDDFAQKSEQLAELIGELEDGLTPDRIIETTEKRFTSDAEIEGLQDATGALATALATGLARKLNSATFTAHRDDKTNPHEVTKAQLGLSNVANKAPADMPVSTDQAEAIGERIRFFAAADPLPEEDIGPIWHEAYASIMTWQVFDANEANYEGYASVNIGQIVADSQPAARPGYINAGATILSITAYEALWCWALHNGLADLVANWSAGRIQFGLEVGGGAFRTPDLRGEFMRFWDDGRGVDNARAFGSAQGHQMQWHTHDWYGPRRYFEGGDRPWVVDGGANFAREWGTTSASGGASNGGETRPRNFAALASIKF